MTLVFLLNILIFVDAIILLRLKIWNRFLSRKKNKIQSFEVAQELYAELKELIYQFPKSEDNRICLLDEVKMQSIFKKLSRLNTFH